MDILLILGIVHVYFGQIFIDLLTSWWNQLIKSTTASEIYTDDESLILITLVSAETSNITLHPPDKITFESGTTYDNTELNKSHSKAQLNLGFMSEPTVISELTAYFSATVLKKLTTELSEESKITKRNKTPY